MGASGDGKSTFIDMATRQGGSTVSHELQSNTAASVKYTRCTHPIDSRPVVFVDTPGSDDESSSVTDILTTIDDWLVKTYKTKANLAAIIYIHRINLNRMNGPREKSLRLFERSWDNKPMPNVILVTTMWGEVGRGIGEEREGDLKTNFWQNMLAKGCRMERFKDTRDSAWNIIGSLAVKDQILIMGLTGVGKSTFINTAAGRTAIPVGHDLQSCTTTIEHVIVHRSDPARRIVFVDTPGFIGNWAHDKQILSLIVDWLASSCSGMKLAGIVYLHEISQARIDPARENLQMFNTLCRHPAFKNVVLATTKWSDMADVDRQRVSEQYWTGADMRPFDNTYESAWAIVDGILNKVPVNGPLISQELINLQKRLSQAGVAEEFVKIILGGFRALSPPDCAHFPRIITTRRGYPKSLAENGDNTFSYQPL